MRRRFGKRYHQPTSQSWSSTSSRLGKNFGASSYRTMGMLTTTDRRSIGKSRITISALGHRPLSLMLPLQTLQRQSPRSVSTSTSSTSFAESQGTTSGMSSWSSWWTKMLRWPPPPMRSSPSLSKRKLQSRERMGSLQKLCSLHRRVAKVVVMAVKPVKAAKVQGGTREIIRETTIGKRRISGSAFIASGEGIPPRTAWASNTAILQSLLTLHQKHQPKDRLLRLSPLRSRTIGWWPALVLHPVIGSSIADARLTSPAVDQGSSPTPDILRIRSRWRDTMGSHRLHLDMEVLGWFVNYQMERRKQSYFKKWCICRDRSISSPSLRSWTRTSKSNRWITTVSMSTIAMASWLPLHVRSMGYSFWITFWIDLRDWPNTPISTMTAACWHLRQLGMHLGMMQRSGCYGTAAWHTSVSRLWRSCQRSLPTLRRWPRSAIARAASSANERESPLFPRPPVLLSLCSLCSRTYAVHWKQRSEEVDICRSSWTTTWGLWMSTY